MVRDRDVARGSDAAQGSDAARERDAARGRDMARGSGDAVVKTHCLLHAAVSLMQDEDKGSEGGRRRRGDWQQSPISGGLGLEVVCERDQ